MVKEIYAILLSLSPITELRGGLIYSSIVGFNPIKAFLICVSANLLVSPLVFLFLSTLHKTLLKISSYARAFNKTIKKLDKKVEAYEKKYNLIGYFALTLFTAIPLPYTGAYTSSIIAWLLGLNKTKSIIAINAGVIIAGILVTIFIYGLISLF